MRRNRLLSLALALSLAVSAATVAQGQTGQMCRSPLTFPFYACRI